MKCSYLVAGLALVAAGTSPASAQTANNGTATQPDAMATAAPAPMSETDQAALTKCKAMTAAQVAQSSKCTRLMKEAGIKAPPKDPNANSGYR